MPGNTQLDLINCGILPKDIYKGMNIKLLEKYENHEWWYQKAPDVPKSFEGKKSL